ncbi:MAG: hypothetical protein VR65_25820 [Desulfobulbaceae bacterium BRH_c16a]|nr:MAG: hypothetical protein VR65_25820 [Desulfobulbaceae bacterium BRH_c16a]
MFLDQELKDIQEAKNRLAVCSDLRRQLVHIEVRSIWGKGHRVLSNLTLGLVVAEQILGLLRERKRKN